MHHSRFDAERCSRLMIRMGFLLPTILMAAMWPTSNTLPTAAQQVASAQDVRLTLYSPRLEWSPSQQGTVTAALYRSGRLLASARTRSAQQASNIPLTLRPEENVRDAELRPGDRLDLRNGSVHQRMWLPSLAAVVDRREMRVWGRGPLTGTLTLTDVSQTAASRVALTVGADGSFEWRPDAGRPIPTGAEGSLRWESPDGSVMVELKVAAPRLYADGAGSHLSVGSCSGNRVTVAIADQDGQITAERNGEQLQDGVRWSDGDDDHQWPAMLPGNRLRLTVVSTLPAARQVFTSTVPVMQLRIDAPNRRILGRVSDSESLSAILDPADPQLRDRRLVLRLAPPDPRDGSRGFEADIPVDIPVEPGLRISLWLWDTDLATYTMSSAIPKLRLLGSMAEVSGVADSGRPITLTWTSATGQLLARRQILPDGTGRFSERLSSVSGASGGSPDRISSFTEGQTLEVDLANGDPRLVQLPRLHARTDPGSMIMSGQTVPRARLELGLGHQQDWVDFLPPFDVGVDEQGSFFVDLREAFDEPGLGPGGAGGDLVLHVENWLDLVQAWAPPLIWQDVASGWFSAVVPEPCDYHAHLLEPDGVATLATLPDPDWLEPWDSGMGILAGRFRDSLGQVVIPRPGSRVRLEACDEAIEVVVPRLELEVSPAKDELRIVTDAFRRLLVSISGTKDKQGFSSEVLANASGVANVDLSGYDLLANSMVSVAALEGEWYSAFMERFAPGLHVDLLTGWISGRWDAGARLDFRWQRGDPARDLVRWQVMVPADGDLRTRGTGAGAGSTGYLPGDRITITPVEGGLASELVVPVLSLEASGPADRPTRGQATPGERVQVHGRHWRYDTASQPRLAPDTIAFVQADAAGQWSATMRREAGDRIWASVFSVEGHEFYRHATRQLSAVQLGAAGACGMTDAPDESVVARLSDAPGQTLAKAEGLSSADGQFHLALNDMTGSPVPTTAGQTLSLTTAGQETRVVLPEWQVKVDWEGLRMSGYGPADQTLTIRPSPPACLPAAEDPWLATSLDWDEQAETWLQVIAETSPSGWFHVDLAPLFPHGRPDNASLEAFWYQDDTTRVFARLYLERLRIHSHSSSLTMRGQPGTRYQVALESADGSPRAAASGVVDSDGWLGLAWQDPMGRTVKAMPGDGVRLISGNQERPSSVLPPLDLDWSPGDPLHLQTAPAQSLDLTLALSEAADTILKVTVDSNGRLTFGPNDLPPTTTWRWQDVKGVQAALPLNGGHWLIAQAGQLPDLAPPPERTGSGPDHRGHRVWLPWLGTTLHR